MALEAGGWTDVISAAAVWRLRRLKGGGTAADGGRCGRHRRNVGLYGPAASHASCDIVADVLLQPFVHVVILQAENTKENLKKIFFLHVWMQFNKLESTGEKIKTIDENIVQKSAKTGGCKSGKKGIAENPWTQSVTSLQSQPPRWQIKKNLGFSGITHSFCLFSIILLRILSFIHPFAEGPFLFPHCSPLSREPPWGAEPGYQQADALLSELRRTLLSYAKKFAKYSYYQRNAIMITITD